jgi:putative hydrolase of the HAD superfamily
MERKKGARGNMTNIAWGKIQWVLFDAVGTLIRPDPPVVRVYLSVARRYGSCLTEVEVGERFHEAFQRQEEIDAGPSGCQTDEARELLRWQTIVADVLDDASEPAAVFNELWRHFAMSEHWRLFGDAAETWQSLGMRGFRLGIASNFDHRLRQVCRGLPPLDKCEHIFVSSELKVRKPSIEFYRRIEQRLQASARQILLVGDDWTNDYLAARQAGWSAVFVDRSGERDGTEDVVRSLGKLVASVA